RAPAHLSTLPLHDALPISIASARRAMDVWDRDASRRLTTGDEQDKRSYMSKLAGLMDEDISLHVQHAPRNADAAHVALTALLRRSEEHTSELQSLTNLVCR